MSINIVLLLPTVAIIQNTDVCLMYIVCASVVLVFEQQICLVPQFRVSGSGASMEIALQHVTEAHSRE